MSDRSARDIQADLEKTREEMTQTVDELAAALNPKTQAKVWLEDGKEKAQNLVEDAKAGDRRALGILGGAAGVVGLVVLAKLRRLFS